MPQGDVILLELIRPSSLITTFRSGPLLIQYVYARSLWLTGTATRQALRYLIRNTTLPQNVRDKAKLQLSRMHCYTRSTAIRNRCIMGGVAKGVFRDFRMGRVSPPQPEGICEPHTSVQGNRDEKQPRLTRHSAVSIPNECACRKLTRGEEGELVIYCISYWRQR